MQLTSAQSKLLKKRASCDCVDFMICPRYPHISVLVCSGALPPRFSGEAPEARFVRKPYRVAEIAPIIRAMMPG